MTDRMTLTMPELKRIAELANEYRQQLVADLAPEFLGREAHALVAALAIMFATSMTPDPAQQSDQARMSRRAGRLNLIGGRGNRAKGRDPT